MDNDKVSIVCGKCNTGLVEKKIRLKYLGHEFFADVPCCPVCGDVYISEDLVTGKMAEVETALEDK